MRKHLSLHGWTLEALLEGHGPILLEVRYGEADHLHPQDRLWVELLPQRLLAFTSNGHNASSL